MLCFQHKLLYLQLGARNELRWWEFQSQLYITDRKDNNFIDLVCSVLRLANDVVIHNVFMSKIYISISSLDYLSKRFLSLSKKFSLSSSTFFTSLSNKFFRCCNPRLGISTSFACPSSLVSIPVLIRRLVGSLSMAAHFRESSSSSSREDLENGSIALFL
jgi:hypothetical protein